jgi:tetratricopeptide (TPR) repeat protein
LWHEFCHVVTLEKTRNKMPRWLSEGISVYEERLKNPTWGQGITPQYRQMLLGDELTPVSRLSGAFLNPPSPVHLQFAYYESSLVVEYLVNTYGIDTLQRILVDLGVGMPINETLARYVGSIQLLDQEFAEFARSRAREFGAALDWEREELPERASPSDWQVWLADHPDNYWGLRAYAAASAREKRWEEARKVLQRLAEDVPEDGGVWKLLAEVHRNLGDEAAEREALKRHAALANDAVETYRRLAELAEAEEDWQQVAAYGERLLAVNPLLPEAQRLVARAAAERGEDALAVSALSALSRMKPTDPAGLHYRLAAALARLDRREEALRHVLMALEDAPRYRDALRLLLELQATQP